MQAWNVAERRGGEAELIQTYAFRAMSTDITMAAEGRPERLRLGFREAARVIREGEARFTRFSARSELSALNAAAGAWHSVSPEMLEVLLQARTWAEQTGGLFNPAVLPALVASGYDRSFEQLASAENDLPPESAAPAVMDFQRLDIDPERLQVRLPRGMAIDLGGVAKGWIADQAARRLLGFADCCGVNAGGDMVLMGLPTGQSAWTVVLEDPRQPEADLARLQVPEGSLATSSVVKRRWQRNGRLRHHIIDPRTGQPAETVWLSVTAIMPSATGAEAFAKALLIGGPDLAAALADRHPELMYLAADRNGQLWGSKHSQEICHDAITLA
jgi:thiamine biosynthesis lipoprotein